MISTAILTVSDSAVAGTRADATGPFLVARIKEIGWTVSATAVVADEREQIAAKLCEWADAGHALILTTGGTGLSARDVTPKLPEQFSNEKFPALPSG